jgi:putative transferase (TIGR04331 family)
LLDDLVQRTMPRSLGADFSTRDAKAAANRYVPGRLFVNGSATVNDDINFQIAHAVQAGERIVRVQHGSDYGTMANLNFEKANEYMNDAFLTWGWTAQNGLCDRFRPVPAPGLSAIRDRHRKRNQSIVLAGTKMVLRNYRVDHAPEPAAVVRYRREKVKFIDGLDANIRQCLQYRGYERISSDLEDAAYVRRHAPDIGSCEGDLVTAMLGCRLLVLDHPGTTLNEAMAANVPTVCFWDPASWPLAPEAVPYFRALADAHVLFPDGASAARHVNAVAGDVAGWWRSAGVQRARRDWADRFARVSAAWWWDWLKVLSKL